MEVDAAAVEQALAAIIAAGGRIVYPEPEPEPVPEPERGSDEWLAQASETEALDWLAETDPDEHLRITDPAEWLAVHDTRARVVTAKPVNLSQLDAELGGPGLASGSADDVAIEGVEVEIVAGGAVSEAQLAKAIEAHVPIVSPLPTPEEKFAALGITPEDVKAIVG